MKYVYEKAQELEKNSNLEYQGRLEAKAFKQHLEVWIEC